MKTTNENNGNSSDAFLLLNGLFFLKHNNGTLMITAPDVPDHMYCIGIPGKLDELTEMPQHLNFMSCLRGRPADEEFQFPPEIPQFSQSRTGTGDITCMGRFQAVVPVPLEIYALRKGYIKDFHPVAGSKVGEDILESSGPELGTLICLRYKGRFPRQWTSTKMCHFYAENAHPLQLMHVNHAYERSQALFSYPKAFDLRLDDHFELPPVIPHAEHLNNLQVRLPDVLNLDELLPSSAAAGAKVANCVQLAMTA